MKIVDFDVMTALARHRALDDVAVFEEPFLPGRRLSSAVPKTTESPSRPFTCLITPSGSKLGASGWRAQAMCAANDVRQPPGHRRPAEHGSPTATPGRLWIAPGSRASRSGSAGDPRWPLPRDCRRSRGDTDARSGRSDTGRRSAGRAAGCDRGALPGRVTSPTSAGLPRLAQQCCQPHALRQVLLPAMRRHHADHARRRVAAGEPRVRALAATRSGVRCGAAMDAGERRPARARSLRGHQTGYRRCTRRPASCHWDRADSRSGRTGWPGRAGAAVPGERARSPATARPEAATSPRSPRMPSTARSSSRVKRGVSSAS